MTDTLELATETPLAGARTGRRPRHLVAPFVFVADFILLVVASLGSGVIYHEIVLGHGGDIGTFFGVACAVFSYFSVFLAYRGSYSVASLSRTLHQVREISIAWAAVFTLMLALMFLLKVGPNLSRGATVVFFMSGWLALVCWRWFVSGWIRFIQLNHGFAKQVVLVISDKQLAGSSRLEGLAGDEYRVVRCLSVPKERADIPRFSGEVLEASRRDRKIAGIFLLMDWDNPERITALVEALRPIPLPVRLFPDPHVARFLSKPVASLGSVWTAELQRAPMTLEERFAKRVLDIAVSSALLVLLSPLMVLAAILIKLDTRGPVFFLQSRNGFNARPFRIIKFRTLTTLEDGPNVAQVTRNDARMTRVGRILRRTSIDELPQLINILRGEMSLVGPRPHATAHSDHYEQLISTYAFRHHVKPGLTGWAQVNGFRGETTLKLMKERVDRDIWYIDNWSLWLDIKILLRTSVIVLQASAY
jgi:Undecaprenyl-phosphate glucose phosphotransferase